jgi:hypothetical protein
MLSTTSCYDDHSKKKELIILANKKRRKKAVFLVPAIVTALVLMATVALAVPEKVQIGTVNDGVEQYTYSTVLPGCGNRSDS